MSRRTSGLMTRGLFVRQELMDLYRDGAISGDDIFLACCVDSLIDVEGVGCYASNQHLARQLGWSAMKVKRTIKKLVELEIIIPIGTVTINNLKYRWLETPWSRVFLNKKTPPSVDEIAGKIQKRCKGHVKVERDRDYWSEAAVKNVPIKYRNHSTSCKNVTGGNAGKPQTTSYKNVTGTSYKSDTQILTTNVVSNTNKEKSCRLRDSDSASSNGVHVKKVDTITAQTFFTACLRKGKIQRITLVKDMWPAAMAKVRKKLGWSDDDFQKLVEHHASQVGKPYGVEAYSPDSFGKKLEQIINAFQRTDIKGDDGRVDKTVW